MDGLDSSRTFTGLSANHEGGQVAVVSTIVVVVVVVVVVSVVDLRWSRGRSRGLRGSGRRDWLRSRVDDYWRNSSNSRRRCLGRRRLLLPCTAAVLPLWELAGLDYSSLMRDWDWGRFRWSQASSESVMVEAASVGSCSWRDQYSKWEDGQGLWEGEHCWFVVCTKKRMWGDKWVWRTLNAEEIVRKSWASIRREWYIQLECSMRERTKSTRAEGGRRRRAMWGEKWRGEWMRSNLRKWEPFADSDLFVPCFSFLFLFFFTWQFIRDGPCREIEERESQSASSNQTPPSPPFIYLFSPWQPLISPCSRSCLFSFSLFALTNARAYYYYIVNSCQKTMPSAQPGSSPNEPVPRLAIYCQITLVGVARPLSPPTIPRLLNQPGNAGVPKSYQDHSLIPSTSPFGSLVSFSHQGQQSPCIKFSQSSKWLFSHSRTKNIFNRIPPWNLAAPLNYSQTCVPPCFVFEPQFWCSPGADPNANSHFVGWWPNIHIHLLRFWTHCHSVKYKLTLYSDNTVSMDKCPSAKQSFQELSIPRKQTTPCWRHTTYYTPTWINLIHLMNQCSRSICECFGVIHHDHPVKLPRFQVPVNLSTSI